MIGNRLAVKWAPGRIFGHPAGPGWGQATPGQAAGLRSGRLVLGFCRARVGGAPATRVMTPAIRPLPEGGAAEVAAQVRRSPMHSPAVGVSPVRAFTIRPVAVPQGKHGHFPLQKTFPFDAPGCVTRPGTARDDFGGTVGLCRFGALGARCRGIFGPRLA